MKKILLMILLLTFYFCKKEEKVNKYPNSIGDITFNAEKDDSNFVLCNKNNVYQYFNDGRGLGYEGEKLALVTTVKEKYKPVKTTQSGLIRIRFIINCKGETGMFRIIQMNDNYEAFSFDKKIINQLLKITKELSGWMIKQRKDVALDYYQYLIFKIKEGEIVEILP